MLILLSALGCLVQIQILFGESDSYMGIRLNLGDFLIPIAGLIILTTLTFKKSSWPKWQKPCHDVWFFLLLGTIIIGLVNAYIRTGEISQWALLNRGVGWGVLTGYIFFAGWSITNFMDKALLVYLRVFLFFALSTIILGTIWFFLTILR